MLGRSLQGECSRATAAFAGLLALAAALTFVPGAQAATFTVNNTTDALAPPAGSLRAAIEGVNASADASNSIVFAPGVTGTIQLVGVLPRVAGQFSQNVDIVGPGANQLTVRGQGTAVPYPVFEICRRTVNGSPAADASVTISGLTISNGVGPGSNAAGGGGIFIDEDIPANGIQCGVTLSGVAVSGNAVIRSFGPGFGDQTALGGGVYLGGGSTLALINTTVSGNTAQAEVTGGGSTATARGGGIFAEPNAGAVTIQNSTISGNTATSTSTLGPSVASGGGLEGASALVRSSTITLNAVSASSTGGGTLTTRGANIAGSVSPPAVGAAPTLQNTIVSAPTGAANCAAGDNGGTPVPLTSLGNNLSSDSSCFLGQNTDFQNTDPLLGPLADNGGPTLTHLPGDGSPAIDMGFSNGLTTDQRGLPRPIQHLGPIQQPVVARVNPAGGDGADIGAVEVQGEFEPGPPILRKIHFSLRFKYVDKHGRRFVTARVFCHSIACVLEGSGRIRILPFKTDNGRRKMGAQTFELGDASGSYVFTQGRKVAGTLRFKVSNRTAQAVKRAIVAGARGKVRGDIRVNGTNTFDPDANKKRFRDVKLFARSRGGRNG